VLARAQADVLDREAGVLLFVIRHSSTLVAVVRLAISGLCCLVALAFAPALAAAAPSNVSLSATKTTVNPGDFFILTATVDQEAWPTHYVAIIDDDANRILTTCVFGTECEARVNIRGQRARIRSLIDITPRSAPRTIR
jgi:hypothetical protein